MPIESKEWTTVNKTAWPRGAWDLRDGRNTEGTGRFTKEIVNANHAHDRPMAL